MRGVRNSLAGAKVSEEGAGEVLQSRSPLRPVVMTMVQQGSTLQHMEETTMEQVDLH